MMRRVLFSFVILLGISASRAVSDTIPDRVYNLNEVSVVAKNISMVQDGFSAVPTKVQRNSTFSGEDLLKILQFPNLIYNARTEQITSSNGVVPQYFINGVPASLDEIRVLLSNDIARVNMLQNPKDPTYGKAALAIDFIVKRYEYGGYILGNIKQYILKSKGLYDVYTKYERRDWTIQAKAGFEYNNHNGDRSILDNKYDFGRSAAAKTIERCSESEVIENENRYFRGTVKATRKKQGRLISLQASLVSKRNPLSLSSGAVYYPDQDLTSEFEQSKNGKSLTPSLSFLLSNSYDNGRHLFIKGNISATFDKNNTIYKSDFEQPIANRLYDKILSPDATVQYFITKDTWQLIPYLYTNYNLSRINSTGSTNDISTILTGSSRLGASYVRKINSRWSIETSLSADCYTSRTEGYSKSAFYPSASLIAEGAAGNKGRLNFSLSTTQVPLSLSNINDVDTKENELEIMTAPRNLTNPLLHTFQGSYNYIASNKVTLGFNVDAALTNKILSLAQTFENDLVSMYLVNSGSKTEADVSVNCTWLLSPKFLICPTLKYEYARRTGLAPGRYNTVEGFLSAYYLPGNGFNISATVASPSARQFVNNYGGISRHYDWTFSFKIAYKHKSFNGYIQANPIKKAPKYTSVAHTPILTMSNVNYLHSANPLIVVGVSYAFNYGKRISADSLNYGSDGLSTNRGLEW